MHQGTRVGPVVCLSLVSCLALACFGVAAEQRPTKRVQPPPQCNPNAVVWRTPKPPANPQKGDVWVNPKDGMEMVYVAPGEFIMGTSSADLDVWLKEHPDDAVHMRQVEHPWLLGEQPRCRVRLKGYWIARTEVTNAQYLRFVQATGHRAPDHWQDGRPPAGLENFPVINVDWRDVCAYSNWARGRLPTEAQWEKAARGGDGRSFPWGFGWMEERCRNLALIMGGAYRAKGYSGNVMGWLSALQDWQQTHDPLREGPAPVGSLPAGASPYGCVDMAGNVEEWCADWYAKDAYRRYAKGDLALPKEGTHRVTRGGSWNRDQPRFFHCASRGRSNPGMCSDFCGFRYAR